VALELVADLPDKLVGHHEQEDVSPSTGFQQVWLCYLKSVTGVRELVPAAVLCVLNPGQGERGLESNCWGLPCKRRKDPRFPCRAGRAEGLEQSGAKAAGAGPTRVVQRAGAILGTSAGPCPPRG